MWRRNETRIIQNLRAGMVGTGAASTQGIATQGVALSNLWRGWQAEPAVLIALAFLLGSYGWGTRALWQRRGGRRSLPWWRVLAFASSQLVIAIALLSPLDRLSGDLLAAHMVQHLLLLIAAPLLLILGRPLLVMRWSLSQSWRRRWVRTWRQQPIFDMLRAGLGSPLFALAVYTVALWLWHMPLLYTAALRNPGLHIVEHLSFLAAATLLWWVVIYPEGGRSRYGISMMLVFLIAVQGSILGALLTFSTVLWYPANSPAAAFWGTTPLADQQLAGLLMWVPPGIFYLATIAMLFALWLAAMEQTSRRRERARARSVRHVHLAQAQSEGG